MLFYTDSIYAYKGGIVSLLIAIAPAPEGYKKRYIYDNCLRVSISAVIQPRDELTFSSKATRYCADVLKFRSRSQA